MNKQETVVVASASGRQRRQGRSLLERARLFRKQATPAEASLWNRLRKKQLEGFKFRRQHITGRYIVDFYCLQARLVVEIDGSVHNHRREQDASRTSWLKAHGLTVIRFTNAQVLDDIDIVLATILQFLQRDPARIPTARNER